MDTYVWFRVIHLIGMVAWIVGIAVAMAGLAGMPHVASDAKAAAIAKLRRLARIMDIGATLAITAGFIMAFTKVRWGGQTAFTTGGWLHAKLFLVVVGILVPHALLQMRVGKLRRNPNAAASEISLPAWVTPVFILAAIAIIVVVGVPTLMRK